MFLCYLKIFSSLNNRIDVVNKKWEKRFLYLFNLFTVDNVIKNHFGLRTIGHCPRWPNNFPELYTFRTIWDPRIT